MLEIYNEEYKDLLGKGPPAGKKHQARSRAGAMCRAMRQVPYSGCVVRLRLVLPAHAGVARRQGQHSGELH